jgi:glycosyltransferase involved in cell wall biosynthesis
MAKIAEIIRFYSLDEIMDFIDKGGEYPLHHVWCYDQIKEKGIQAECIGYDNKTRWNRFGEKLQIFNLQQQINLLKKSDEYDLVYAPFVADVFLLALMKSFGLYKKPILALALDTHIPFKKSYLKRLKQRLLRSVYNHGIDSFLYFNEQMYHTSNEYGPMGRNNGFAEWGADLDFFTSFVERQTLPPSLDFIYSTGGTGRDFKTLIKAFEDIDFDLKITTKRSEEYNMYIPPNVIIDDSVVPGLHSVGIIRKEYYNALAVAIPLRNTGQLWPVGITVIMEALAMSKPIISTYNPMYPFNLEKEKVGLYVDHYSVNGWRQVAEYLIKNPDEAREMGERGRYLCEKKYNYEVFSNEVINQIKKYIFVENKEVAKKAEVPEPA